MSERFIIVDPTCVKKQKSLLDLNQYELRAAANAWNDTSKELHEGLFSYDENWNVILHAKRN